MWMNLSNFMNKYHTNDTVERLFIIWQLALAMIYGNNAPDLVDDTAESQTNIPIIVYLISRFSYTVLEGAYSVYLPFHRRGALLRFLTALPTVGIWIGALYTVYPVNAGLLITAIFMEFLIYSLVETPLFEKFLREERSKVFDADHWVERIQDFFIIILGEGVLNLIKGSPLGRGITPEAGTGVVAMIIYFFLSALYFNGDQSRKYVHAVMRTFYRKALWVL